MSLTVTGKITDSLGVSTVVSAVATQSTSAPITIGETAITPTSDSGNANLLVAQQAALAQAGTIQSLSFYVTTPAGKLRLGIYDASGPNGGPGKLLAQTAEITPVAGWNTANVLTQVSLVIGHYWLAYLPSDGNLGFKNGSPGTSRWYNFAYGAMPAIFSPAITTNSNVQWSFYATLSSTPPPPPPPPQPFTVAVSANPAADLIVTGAGTFMSGTSVTVTATPQSGFFFVNWTDAIGNVLSTSPSYTFVVTKNMVMIAQGSPVPNPSILIPANRLTVFQPGVTYNAIPAVGVAGNIAPSNYNQAGYGIPVRNTIFTTLSPVGGGGDDGAPINAALAACPPGQVVKLTTGVFNLLTNIRYLPSAGRGFTGGGDITLRGSGPGAALNFGTSPVNGTGTFTPDSTATQLYYGNTAQGFGPALSLNGADTFGTYGSITNLAADALQGSYTCTLVSDPGLVPGQLVRIDQNCSLAAVATINASAAFSTSSNTIAMSGTGAAVLPGMWVYDLSQAGAGNSSVVGFVQSYIGTTLVLTGNALINSNGSGDSLMFSLYPFQSSDPDIWWGPNNGNPGAATRFFFNRGDRVLQEVKEVATYNSSTKVVTFTTPFHHRMCAGSGTSATGVVGGLAQLCTFGSNAFIWGMGLEELQVAFGLAGGNGNIDMGGCAYSWIRHVESYWSNGASVLMAGCFRCETRDSFIHESSSPNPGGAGYLMDFQWGTADSLAENCIFWNGNKQIVGQATGGGNVVAYCYGADAFGAGYPSLTEAGMNMAHMCGSHMELMEGNESHRFDADTYWGNVIDQTVFRNNFTTLRPAHAPLNTYTTSGQPYVDGDIRAGISIGAYAYRQNIVGNVLGYSGMSLIVDPPWVTQTRFNYEELDLITDAAEVMMYYIGSYQGPASALTMVPGSYATQLRQGNWDWFTQTQKWHGIGGSVEYGSNPSPPYPAMPNSLYLTGKPPFFVSNSYSANTWPWVNPSNGTTAMLPAKARFVAGTPNTL